MKACIIRVCESADCAGTLTTEAAAQTQGPANLVAPLHVPMSLEARSSVDQWRQHCSVSASATDSSPRSSCCSVGVLSAAGTSSRLRGLTRTSPRRDLERADSGGEHSDAPPPRETARPRNCCCCACCCAWCFGAPGFAAPAAASAARRPARGTPSAPREVPRRRSSSSSPADASAVSGSGSSSATVRPPRRRRRRCGRCCCCCCSWAREHSGTAAAAATAASVAASALPLCASSPATWVDTGKPVAASTCAMTDFASGCARARRGGHGSARKRHVLHLPSQRRQPVRSHLVPAQIQAASTHFAEFSSAWGAPNGRAAPANAGIAGKCRTPIKPQCRQEHNGSPIKSQQQSNNALHTHCCFAKLKSYANTGSKQPPFPSISPWLITNTHLYV
eukprot:364033-Chlamydomonas_euryale.AAC.10